MIKDLRRPNCFTIDLQVVADSTRAIRDRIGPRARFFATVKADAYGFGLLPVAQTTLAHGADSLSLVRFEDAVALREAGIDCPILLYAGYVLTADHVRLAEAYDLTLTISDRYSLEVLAAAATRRLGCAIKIECGLERIGVLAEDIDDFARDIAASGKLRVEVINGHPHVVEGDDEYMRWQFERFARACEVARRHFAEPPDCIFASSRVIASRDMTMSGVDPGQALFQLPLSLARSPEEAERTPFAALTSRLIHVYDVRRERFVEQSAVPTKPGARIGIVPIGSGDGAAHLTAGVALVGGRRAPQVASPSLEYLRLDLSGCPNAGVGDEVVFVGEQGGERIRVQEVMRHAGTDRVTNVAMQVGQAVPRRYLPARQPAEAKAQEKELA
jgi:alanine racemase